MDGNLMDITSDCRLHVTCGAFATEAESQKWIVHFLRTCHTVNNQEYFDVREFVPGVSLFRHHRQEVKECFVCDVLLIPKLEIVRRSLGAIVVEVKRSNEKIGPGINQLKDYMSSAFSAGGVMVVPSFGFMFPCHKQNKATASWMQHQSMGSICHGYKGNVEFWSGEELILEFRKDGELVRFNEPRSGRRSGSR